ncbi:MAG: DNA-binding domain-containing protein [Thermoanaerobaculia bacterium]|nr:DNA-binding domain-containing protein [Thermoanaerobaculia bacterium]
MSAELPLERVQRWMLEVVTQPGSVRDALASPPARREIERERLPELILPSRTLSSEQRLGVYHDMYMLRMVEALEFDYPGVAKLLGHARFHRLVEGYVGAFPSRSYTLNRLGDHLPEYIASHGAMPRRALLADLARFELAITLAFDAARSATLSPEAILSVPAEAWAEARFRTIDALQLLRVDYPVDDYLQSIKDGGTRPPLRKATRWILVFRSELSVRRVALSKREWTMLEALHEGLTLPAAVDRMSAFRPRISETELFTWFREWTRMGLFSAIELAGS